MKSRTPEVVRPSARHSPASAARRRSRPRRTSSGGTSGRFSSLPSVQAPTHFARSPDRPPAAPRKENLTLSADVRRMRPSSFRRLLPNRHPSEPPLSPSLSVLPAAPGPGRTDARTSRRPGGCDITRDRDFRRGPGRRSPWMRGRRSAGGRGDRDAMRCDSLDSSRTQTDPHDTTRGVVRIEAGRSDATRGSKPKIRRSWQRRVQGGDLPCYVAAPLP